LLEQARGAGDIGKEKGNGASRQIRHSAVPMLGTCVSPFLNCARGDLVNAYRILIFEGTSTLREKTQGLEKISNENRQLLRCLMLFSLKLISFFQDKGNMPPERGANGIG
jgi:hypothetical protein